MLYLRFAFTIVAVLIALVTFTLEAALADEALPELALDTHSIEIEVEQGSLPRISVPIRFANAGGAVLLYDFTPSYNLCGRADIPRWLTVVPRRGSLKPHESGTVMAVIQLAQLPVGNHAATICLYTNAPGQTLTPIPVSVAIY